VFATYGPNIYQIQVVEVQRREEKSTMERKALEQVGELSPWPMEERCWSGRHWSGRRSWTGRER
jgi:hypothetical protein